MSNLTPRPNRYERNLFINGNFDFNQRRDIDGGTGYFFDRFRTSGLAGGAISTFAEFSQNVSADVPFGDGRSALFTAGALITPDASDPFGVVQNIEGFDFAEYLGEEVTFSFYTKANHLATYGLSFMVAGPSPQSISFPVTTETIGQWQRHSWTFTLPSTFSGTLDNTTAFSFVFDFLETPAFSTSTIGTFESGTKRGIVGQDNFFSTIGNTFQMSKILMVRGKDPGENFFVRRGWDRAEEALKCLRYYFQTGTNANYKAAPRVPRARMGAMGGAVNFWIPFKVPMRTTPNVTVSTSGTSTGLLDGGTVAEDIHDMGFSYRIQPNTSSWSTLLPYIVDAEL